MPCVPFWNLERRLKLPQGKNWVKTKVNLGLKPKNHYLQKEAFFLKVPPGFPEKGKKPGK